MTGRVWTEPDQVAEDGDRLVRFSLLFKQMGQRMP